MEKGTSPRMTREEREKYLSQKLRQIVKHAYEKAPAMKKKLDAAGVTPTDIHTLKDLEKVPVTTKDELVELQKETPFGGFLAVPMESLERIYISPGPLYEAYNLDDFTRGLRDALSGLGIGKGDRVLNTMSYHLVPAGLANDYAMRKVGATVIPTGVGNTELQVKVMRDLKVTGYGGTPSFLVAIIKKAEEMGYDFRRDFQLRWAALGAEMVPPSLKRSLKEDYGIDPIELYGTADLGIFAYECEQKSGMHIVEDIIVEILDPNTRKQLGSGVIGEVVGTIFDEIYPLIRFATGDLSYYSDEPCACGRTSIRLMRIVGRVGEAVKIRAMFVHPRQIEQVFTAFPEVARFQLVVDHVQRRDVTTLKVELGKAVADKEGLSRDIQKRFSEICTVKTDAVQFVAPGTIPAEAKVILDQRTWE